MISILQNGEIIENASALAQQKHDIEIDKKDLGELWIAQLTLGEYSDLDAGERLNALVAVIDLSIAGNSLRIILEVKTWLISFFLSILLRNVSISVI